MSSSHTSTTRPEDKVPFIHMLAYGSGAFVNNLLSGAIGALMAILNLGLGMNPALVGLLASIPRLFDAFTDPLIGYASDNTQTRWGRRRPYIFIGAILVGLCFMALWQLPAGQSESFYFWYFLIGSLFFFLAYTIFITPWVALGYELTPDYNERTKLMGTQNFIGQIAYFIPPWLLLLTQNERFFSDMREGAAGVSIGIGFIVILFGLVPAIILRERSIQNVTSTAIEKKSIGETISVNFKKFIQGFVQTLRFRPFLKLCLATFLIFNGFILIAAFQTYVAIYYLYDGDKVEGAKIMGYIGTITTFATFGVIAFVTWLATKVGKIRAFTIATTISIFGYLLKWPCYNPEMPLLILIPAPLLAFSLGGLFTLMPAMIADVVDLDELETGERREGMFGSIFWWVVKLGLTAALAGGGFLLNATGFDVALDGDQSDKTLFLLRVFDVFIPALASVIAIIAVASFGMSPEKAAGVREELERRRGVLQTQMAG